MFKNYFKTAFRNFSKHKVTGFINLFGLSVGMTAAVLIFLWVKNEMSYDDYHPQKDQIFRITHDIAVSKDETWKWENSPLLLGKFAKQEVPEIKRVSVLLPNSWGGPAIKINNNIFSEKKSAYVGKEWFSMFHYDFIEGNAVAFGQDPFGVVLTKEKAKKYFGIEQAVGKTIQLDSVNYTVRGVVKNIPLNSSFQFELLYQIDGRLSNPAIQKNDKTWSNFNYITFVQLNSRAESKTVASKLNTIINREREAKNDKISLQALTGMYFETGVQNSNLPHGSRNITYIFSVLAIMLLITACINYVNLTTARASLRAKEVGVRKVVGAQRGHLFFQFIAESLMMSLFALGITLLLIQLTLPAFNAITEKNFVLPLLSLDIWQILLGTLLFATILNGIYPAILLSSFNPMNVFRGKSILSFRDGAVRKVLVVFQFSLSIILILGTIIIFRQLKFIQTTDPGYSVSQVISLQAPYRSYAAYKGDSRTLFFETLRRELAMPGTIEMVSTGNEDIVNVESSSSGNADWDGHDSAFAPTVGILNVDTDFNKLFKLKLTKGHWFNDGKEDEKNFIINETAERMFNIPRPVMGQRFIWGGDTGKIIAVVKDFHYKSLHEKIGPIVIANNMGVSSHFFIRSVSGKIPETLASLEKVWHKFMPAEPFEYTFMDESFERLYKADIKTSRLILMFSIIAILIAALGLFGLATFTTEQRIKEVGIRKVLGASVHSLVILLSKDFMKLVLIALLIACPIALFLVNKWLQDFAYRQNISWWIFGLTAFIAITITIITVSSQAIKAAIANPVKNLRTE